MSNKPCAGGRVWKRHTNGAKKGRASAHLRMFIFFSE